MVHTERRLLPIPMPGTVADLGTLFSIISSLLIYQSLLCGGGWLALRWLGADSLQFTELAGLIGYSLVLVFPAAAVGALTINVLAWVAMILAATASVIFIYQNLASVLRTSAMGPEKGTIYTAVLCVIHLVFLLSVKIAYI